MKPTEERSNGEGGQLEYVPMDNVVVYPVTEDELTTLEKGDGESALGTISVSCIGVTISLVASMLVAENIERTPLTVLIAIAAFCGVAGVICGILWFLSPSNRASVAKRVRARNKAAAAPEAAPK